jgi:iron complex outermembrane receptor protein
VTNAGAARIRGVELEAAARPTPDLRLELTASYLDARFVKYSTIDASRPSLGTLDLAGNYLTNAPPYTISTGAYYTFHLPRDQTLEVGGRVYGQGETYFSAFNLAEDSQDPVFRADLTAFYTINDHWTVNAFARNVTNALVRNYGQALANVVGGAFVVNYDPGRSVGITAAWRF